MEKIKKAISIFVSVLIVSTVIAGAGIATAQDNGTIQDSFDELNLELDELIDEVNDADITPSVIKRSLVNKLKRAKTFKDMAKIAHKAGNIKLSKRYLELSKRQVESFEDKVKIKRQISQADKDSFLEKSAEIKDKIDTLIKKFAEKPDLVIEDEVASWSDGILTVDYTISNIGGSDAGASTTTITIWLNVPTGTPVQTDEDPVGELATGASESRTFSKAIECPCGDSLWVQVCADAGDAVEESDEANNCCDVIEVVCPTAPEPDLVITDASASWSDDTLTVGYTLSNIGCGDADASTTCVYVDGEIVKSDAAQTLASGGIYRTTTYCSVDCPYGETIEVQVCADDNGDVVDESDEDNNCCEVIEVVCPAAPGPDLVITYSSADWSDGILTVGYTVSNIGDSDASASTTCVYVDDEHIAACDSAVPPLPSGGTHSATTSCSVDCPSGRTIAVKVCADDYDTVEEGDENNNCEVNEVECPAIVVDELWVEITLELDELIDEVNDASLPGYIKRSLVNKLKRAKTFKDVAKIAYEDGNSVRAKRYLELSKRQVESFEDKVKIKRQISQADKDSFLEKSAEIKDKIDTLIKKFAEKPDLVIEDEVASWSDGILTVDYTISNIGGSDAGASTTTITIWLNVPTGTPVQTDEDPVGELATGASESRTFSKAIECPCGDSLWVQVCADAGDAVEESDEANNCCDVIEVVCPTAPEPDLVITDASASWSDDTLTVGYTLSNIGCGDADASTTCVYVDGEIVKSDAAQTLASGGIYRTTTYCSVDCPYGETIEVQVCADDNGDVVDESDEDNNCCEVIEVVCPAAPGPDLVITYSSADWSDGILTVGYTVSNIGDSDASASTTCVYVDDEHIAACDSAVPPLPSGGTHSATTSCSVDCPSGRTIAVKVCADDYDTVEEGDENNNCEVNEVECPAIVVDELWVEITLELDELIDEVNDASLPGYIKRSLVNKLKRAKTFKDVAKIAYEDGNSVRAKRYLELSKRQVESFEDRVKTDSRISQEYKDSFLGDSAEIKGKIDGLIGKL